MRYVVDIPPELAEEINRQVKSGRYKTPQDFVLAALQNQTYLESVQVEGDSLQQTVAPAPPTQPAGDRLYQSLIDFLKEPLLPPDPARVHTVSLSEFQRHDHLFGLTNRLFPVKPVVRVLGNLLAESGTEYIGLDQLQEKSAEAANPPEIHEQFGRHFAEIDPPPMVRAPLVPKAPIFTISARRLAFERLI